jgi:hypothetical protein
LKLLSSPANNAVKQATSRSAPMLKDLSGHGFTGRGKKPYRCHPEPPLGVRDLLFDFAFVGAPACCTPRRPRRKNTAQHSRGLPEMATSRTSEFHTAVPLTYDHFCDIQDLAVCSLQARGWLT